MVDTCGAKCLSVPKSSGTMARSRNLVMILRRGRLCRGPKLSLAFVLLCAMTASSCSAAAPKTFTVTEKDSSSTITVRIGDHVVVRLSASIGAGYSWQLAGPDTEALAEEAKPSQEQPPETEPGETETQVFRFIAKGKGEVALRFDYS